MLVDKSNEDIQSIFYSNTGAFSFICSYPLNNYRCEKFASKYIMNFISNNSSNSENMYKYSEFKLKDDIHNVDIKRVQGKKRHGKATTNYVVNGKYKYINYRKNNHQPYMISEFACVHRKKVKCYSTFQTISVDYKFNNAPKTLTLYNMKNMKHKEVCHGNDSVCNGRQVEMERKFKLVQVLPVEKKQPTFNVVENYQNNTVDKQQLQRQAQSKISSSLANLVNHYNNDSRQPNVITLIKLQKKALNQNTINQNTKLSSCNTYGNLDNRSDNNTDKIKKLIPKLKNNYTVLELRIIEGCLRKLIIEKVIAESKNNNDKNKNKYK